MAADPNYTAPAINRVTCPCGCERYGVPRRKVWQGETLPHVNRCECRRCQGGRYKARARIGEHKTAKLLGGRRSYASGVDSGYDGIVHGVLVWEETANVALTRTLFRWWDSKGTQTKIARVAANGLLPWCFIAKRKDGPELAVIPVEQLAHIVLMAREASGFGGSAA